MNFSSEPIHILLVEDSPSQAALTVQAFRKGSIQHQIHVVESGEQAIAFLHHQEPYHRSPRPHIILLDIKLPTKSGLEVLAEIKADLSLRVIPVIMLSNSENEADILSSYQNYANCYLNKPSSLDQFQDLIRLVEQFWLTSVKLPPISGTIF
ncbi:response regulator [Roseofilum capinflatum]|uniref:Response regulator n=1 Tax=Roseofilum capinflatum BLCC-M114 TaxID=3022440 RepID=A0ABT7BAZ3_9CYAN|nr:response regulator [Roseofilum capinflatum]MDJ1176340.1 response regulator [Roseofilum capinflatum BLCC-M114]